MNQFSTNHMIYEQSPTPVVARERCSPITKMFPLTPRQDSPGGRGSKEFMSPRERVVEILFQVARLLSGLSSRHCNTFDSE